LWVFDKAKSRASKAAVKSSRLAAELHHLGGERLDRRERVLHAMVQLVDQELALLLRLLALGDVDQAADHPLEAPVGVALGDGAVPDPDPVTVAVTDRYSASYCEAWCSNSGWRASS